MQEAKPNKIEINEAIVKSILEKVEDVFHDPNGNLISVDEIKALLEVEEIKFIDMLLGLTPKDLNVDLTHWGGKEYNEHNFIRISGQAYTHNRLVVGENGEEVMQFDDLFIRDQFLPSVVFEKFNKLNEAIEAATGKKILVQSGFRSRGYQLLVFLNYLRSKNFDIYKTAELVALPGYSEHEDAEFPAIDFLDPDNRKFVDTEQYQWLLENGESYGFRESFPEGNDKGIQHEPWHWKYI